MSTEPGKWSKGPFNGGSIGSHGVLPAPSRFATFTMESFGISNTRSLHNDTDFVTLSATVGANPTVFVTKSMEM